MLEHLIWSWLCYSYRQDLESWVFLSYSDASLGFFDDIVLVLVEVWLPYVLTFLTISLIHCFLFIFCSWFKKKATRLSLPPLLILSLVLLSISSFQFLTIIFSGLITSTDRDQNCANTSQLIPLQLSDQLSIMPVHCCCCNEQHNLTHLPTFKTHKLPL